MQKQRVKNGQDSPKVEEPGGGTDPAGIKTWCEVLVRQRGVGSETNSLSNGTETSVQKEPHIFYIIGHMNR